MDHEARLELRELRKELGTIADTVEKMNGSVGPENIGGVCDLITQLATQVRILAHYVEKLVERAG
jgi:hypothetical protein